MEKQTHVLSVIRNFRNGNGWEAVTLELGELEQIQLSLRKFNRGVVEESLADAQELLGGRLSPFDDRAGAVSQLAVFMASQRTVNVRTALEEYLKAKIHFARRNHEENGGDGE